MPGRPTAARLIDHRNARVAGDVGTLLGIWAHPDDEAYLSAGLMAAARAAGSRVVVATATTGERGTSDPQRWPPDRLAATRRRELAASLAALDVGEHHWLGYADGTLPDVPPALGAAAVEGLIRRYRPDTIVTFGPDGFTGHPDHRAVSGWVDRAWTAAGHPVRLWHVSLTPEFHQRWGALSSEMGVWMPGGVPPSEPAGSMACTVRCTGDLLDRKFAALTAHATQTAALIERVGPAVYRRWWGTEHFVDAGSRLARAAA
jgi:LmbE family N-acetylglucosaminyl deacetylase